MSQEYIQSCGSYQLVFGLRWFPVLGASTAQQARNLYKRHHAKAWVVAGRHFSSVGLSMSGFSARAHHVSAAVCFATLFPRGVHAAIYQLTAERYWLIAAHEGTPLRHGDMVFGSVEQAQQRVQQLTVHHTTLVLQPEVLSIQALIPLLTQRMRLKAKMQPIRQRRWAWVAGAMVVVSLVYWSYVPRVSVAAVDPAPVFDPYQHYWEQQSRPASHYVALQVLLEHWQQLPLTLAAWRLADSNCQVQKTAWQCIHSFKPTMESANVLDFQQQQPSEWQMVQADLQHIQVQTQVVFQSTDPRRWRASQALQAELLAKLQRIKPAFQTIKLQEPVRYLAKNTAIATSPEIRPIFEQSLSLQAPLRSLALLLDFDEHFYWEKASFIVNQKAKATLKQSAVQVQLHGVAYARD